MLQYIVLDLVFLLVSVFVILLFRFQDRKDRQIYLVKTYMERLKNEISDKETELDDRFSAMSSEIEMRKTVVSEMIVRVNDSLSVLDSRAADLAEMQRYMTHYHAVLKELSGLTDTAQKHLDALQGDLLRIDDVRSASEDVKRTQALLQSSLDQMGQQLEAIRQEKLKETELDVAGRISDLLEQIEQDRESFRREYRKALETLDARMEQLSAVSVPVSDTASRQVSGHLDDEQVFSEPGLGTRLEEIDSEIASLAEELGGVVAAEGPDGPEEPVEEEDSSELFDLLDEENTEADLQEVEELLVETEASSIEEKADEASLIYEQTVLDQEDEEDDEEDEEDVDEEDEQPYDELFIEDEEEILFDAPEDEEYTEAETPSYVTPERRALVEEHLREGFSVSEISELTDIPKGEIELIRELSDFSN